MRLLSEKKRKKPFKIRASTKVQHSALQQRDTPDGPVRLEQVGDKLAPGAETREVFLLDAFLCDADLINTSDEFQKKEFLVEV